MHKSKENVSLKMTVDVGMTDDLRSEKKTYIFLWVVSGVIDLWLMIDVCHLCLLTVDKNMVLYHSSFSVCMGV